jgi:uncharacterized alpha-E superfamily protein
LPSLLARFAESIYWLGRYLERAENLSRILDINETYARDDAGGPSWRRVLDLYADTERFQATHETIDVHSVVWYYLFDRDNPSSIVNCIDLARENARSVRHLISTEMWTQVNIFRKELSELRTTKVGTANLSGLCHQVIHGCQSFEGVAEGTFFRGEPWCFYQIGKYVERADQTTRILDMGYDRLSAGEGYSGAWVDWNVLLRSVCGYHAYRSRHPGASDPHDIATFLLYDTEFPRAVALCVERITSRLQEIERRHLERRKPGVEAKRRELEFLLETGPGRELTPQSLHRYLDQIQIALAALSDEVGRAYFTGR